MSNNNGIDKTIYSFVIVVFPMMPSKVDSQTTRMINRVITEVTAMLCRLISMTGIVPFKCHFEFRIKFAIRAAESVLFFIRRRRLERSR